MAKKIILWSLVCIIALISILLITLACTSISGYPKINTPNIIFVYRDGEQDTHKQVLRADETKAEINYDLIYDEMKKSFKQNSLKAFFNGSLFKKYKVNKTPNQTVDFSKGTYIIYHFSNYNGETQQVKTKGGKAIKDASYEDVLVKVEPKSDIDKIVFYLGSFTGTTFSYNYTYETVGNLTNLAYKLNV